MKRIKVLVFLINSLLVVCLQAQSHISNAFELEKEWILTKNASLYNQKGLVGCVTNNKLYCCHRRGFHDKETQYQAKINVVDMKTGVESEFSLELPEKNVNAYTAKQYWIRSMQVSENQILIFTHDAILIYQQKKNMEYKFSEKIVCDMPEMATRYDKGLWYITKDPEQGCFALNCPTTKSNQDVLAKFSLDGAFMAHYEPNGFIKIIDSTLYFLNSPNLSIQQYSLQEEKKIQLLPVINNWLSIPDTLIQKINAMPYGSERAMHTFFQLKKYSFPLEIFPLCDTILFITYHTYNEQEDKEEIQSTMIRHDGKGNIRNLTTYSHRFDDKRTITDDEFPLYFAQNHLRLNIIDKDRIIQIVREAPIMWQGKTGQEYVEEAEQYLSQNAPQLRLRISKLKTTNSNCTLNDFYFSTYNNSRFTCDSLPTKKAIFIVNNPPQCHDCEENLYAFLNTIDTSTVSLFVVFNNADSYLTKKDLLTYVQQHLSISFTPLYIPIAQKKQFFNQIKQTNFPLILLFDTTDFTIIPNEQIFSSNSISSSLNNHFYNLINHFLQ